MLGFLAQISVEYSRGWIVLFYVSTLGALIVCATRSCASPRMARAAGPDFGATHLSDRHRRSCRRLHQPLRAVDARHQHSRLPLPHAGRDHAPRPRSAATALDRDLAEAVASVRSLEPDAIFVLLPWSATDIIERCAETFLALPVEIHLGPGADPARFDEVRTVQRSARSSSLQLTRLPLSRVRRSSQKRMFDLLFAGVGAAGADAAAGRRRHPHQTRQSGAGVLRPAPLRIQSAAVPHHQVSHHARARRRQPLQARATIRA